MIFFFCELTFNFFNLSRLDGGRYLSIRVNFTTMQQMMVLRVVPRFLDDGLFVINIIIINHRISTYNTIMIFFYPSPSPGIGLDDDGYRCVPARWVSCDYWIAFVVYTTTIRWQSLWFTFLFYNKHTHAYILNSKKSYRHGVQEELIKFFFIFIFYFESQYRTLSRFAEAAGKITSSSRQ